jgi:hypothetical protein
LPPQSKKVPKNIPAGNSAEAMLDIDGHLPAAWASVRALVNNQTDQNPRIWTTPTPTKCH